MVCTITSDAKPEDKRKTIGLLIQFEKICSSNSSYKKQLPNNSLGPTAIAAAQTDVNHERQKAE